MDGVCGPLIALVLTAISSAPESGTPVDSIRPSRAVGRVRGRKRNLALAQVQDGVHLELEAALFFVWMRDEALKAGISLRIRSGFRTFREQKRLYRCFADCSCNECRRAARPGFSSHESGRAVDLDVRNRRVRVWLKKNARRFGFVRTVKSEPWHFEYPGR